MGTLLLLAWCAVVYFIFSRRAARKEIAKLKEQLNALNEGRTPEEIMSMNGVIMGN